MLQKSILSKLKCGGTAPPGPPVATALDVSPQNGYRYFSDYDMKQYLKPFFSKTNFFDF